MSDPTQPSPETPQPAYADVQPAPGAVPPPVGPGAPTNNRTNGLAVTALVLGVVAFVLAFIPFVNMFGAFVALVGLILGVVAIFQKRASKPLAISGAAVSFVAGVLSIIMIAVYAAAFVTAVNDSISKPVASAAPSAQASASASASPSANSNYAFGDTVTYKDGLAITVSAPTPYTPSSSAAGADQASNIQFTITVKNGTSKNYDPLLYPTVSSAGTEASDITDIENKVGLPPSTAVPAGGSITYVAAFSVADPSKLVFDISPGFGYDKAVFQN